ncbi:integrin beta-like protein A [Argopecten irradians]|uniref:integrin beta-like protein A n=1 Tax=Argopecten irradians TaxID=31199 RepID=UPI003717314B
MSLVLLSLMLLLDTVLSTHFRGGTISWKPLTGNTVEFKFKMGWSHGKGPGCTAAKIGQFVSTSFISDDPWKCVKGCGGTTYSRPTVGPVYYYCTGASQAEDWEQGQNSFNYTFPGLGPYTISYTGTQWRPLSYGHNGDWNLQTIVDLHQRSDTGRPNSSPITSNKPLFEVQFTCHHELKIPMVDPDGDNLKCRWAVGDECASVCKSVPVANLNQTSCTLVFTADNTNFVTNGWYAVAITIEDFPKSTITIGGNTFTPSDPISAIPVQMQQNNA